MGSDTFCNPLAPACGAGEACAVALNAVGDFLGYGTCAPSGGGVPVGSACPGAEACTAGTICSQAQGGDCEPACDPFGAATCPSGQVCYPVFDSSDIYSGVGSCGEPQPGLGQAQDPCTSNRSCSGTLICATQNNGATECTAYCPIWVDAGCPPGSACSVLVGQNDVGWGIGGCFFSTGTGDNGAACTSSLDCIPELSCYEYNNGSFCGAACDSLVDRGACGSGNFCTFLPSPDAGFSGYGQCGRVESGHTHSGESCTLASDCVSGDCYFESFFATSGTCIDPCLLGAAFGCGLTGSCLDAGFGGGLGMCLLADGGPWD